MFHHTIRIGHNREPLIVRLTKASVDSDVDITADSTDLVLAWEEALSRMPSDLYEALRRAMPT